MATQVTVGQKSGGCARILGENPSDIRTDNPRWVDMLQEGVIVKITLRRWRGRTRLDLDGDLGIPINGEGELYRDLLDIGNKLLLPRRIQKELDSINSAARQNLERFGYKTHWGMFIPATRTQAWKAKNGEYQDKYFAARDEIVKFYDDIIARQFDRVRRGRPCRLQAPQPPSAGTGLRLSVPARRSVCRRLHGAPEAPDPVQGTDRRFVRLRSRASLHPAAQPAGSGTWSRRLASSGRSRSGH